LGGRSSINVPVAAQTPAYPLSEKDAAQARQPWFVEFEPGAAVAGGAASQVDYTQGWRDFVATHIGFTSETIGFPATAGRFKVQIQDIQASASFQPAAWNITSLIGGNFGVSDSGAVEIPVPWVFLEKTTIRITFNNITALACLPNLLLYGYLTVWQREAAAAQGLQELDLAYKKSMIAMVQQGNKW